MKDQPIAEISESLLERIITLDYGADSHKVKEKLSKIQSDSEAGKRRIWAAILKIANSDET
ncbi:MAG: hypothetical protein ABI581_14770 [Sediminibacterium sp.]